MKSIYISVTNDLVIDARAHRTCLTLIKSGASVKLIGIKGKKSPGLEKGYYSVKRLRIPVTKGFFFYFFYNLRLLIYLLTRKRTDILVSCDLDTLPANYLTSLIRNCTLVFDSHEYFTELPELQNRKFVRKVWLTIEELIFPRLKFAYTVSNLIAEEYLKKYKLKFDVIRNLPVKLKSSTDYPLPPGIQNKKKILYQGAVNLGRGIEVMMEAVKEMSDNIVFIIAGEGELYEKLKRQSENEDLQDKVIFTGRIAHEKLSGLTRQADLGISIEEDMGKNYRYALPNKLFDYIQAGIPVLVSDLPEMREVVKKYDVGLVVETYDPLKIKEQVEFIIHNKEARKRWKINLDKAGTELNWEKEEYKLKEIFTRAGLTFME